MKIIDTLLPYHMLEMKIRKGYMISKDHQDDRKEYSSRPARNLIIEVLRKDGRIIEHHMVILKRIGRES